MVVIFTVADSPPAKVPSDEGGILIVSLPVSVIEMLRVEAVAWESGAMNNAGIASATISPVKVPAGLVIHRFRLGRLSRTVQL